MSDPLHSSDDESYEGLFDQLTEVEIKLPSWKDKYAQRKISPRVRIAARLYNTGIARTLGEAAKLAGLHPGTLYAMNVSDNEEFNRISGQAAKDSDIATGDISQVLQRLGRGALQTIEDLRINADKDETKLKAAIDLADRSPETSKVHKMQVQAITLDGKDVAALAAGLVEAAEVEGRFKEMHSGDYVKVTTEVQSPQLSLPAPHEEVTNDQ